MKVAKGSLVEVLSKADGDKPLTQPKETIPEPEVLYYDAEIILANKPAGLLSVATDRGELDTMFDSCLLYTSPSPRDGLLSRMPSSA